MKPAQFLKSLSTDVVMLREYAADPVASMESHGLTRDEQLAILSGNPKRISEVVGGSMAAIEIMICINLTDPT